MENKFVTDVVKLIKNKNAKKSIQAELESHILDKADYYMEIGYSKDEAFKRATEEMGDAEETAVPLNGIHFKSTVLEYALVCFVFILQFLFYSNEYGFNYMQSTHYITIDFLSTAIFFSYIILLWYSNKHKYKSIPFAILISFCSMFLSTVFLDKTDISVLFQPMVYSIVSICTRGFSFYLDSIFAYSEIIPTALNTAIYHTLSIVLSLVIIVIADLVYMNIYKQEKLISNKRLNAIIKKSTNIIIYIIILDIILTATSTVIAYNQIDNSESNSQQREMIDYILDADISLTYTKQLERLNNNGYKTERDIYTNRDVYISKSNKLELISNLSERYYEIVFETTRYKTTTLCDETDKNYLEQTLSGTTLDKFLKYPTYSKACFVSRKIDNGDDWIIFTFWLDETYYNICFVDNIMISNDLEDNSIYTSEIRGAMIDSIVTDSQFNNSTELDDMLIYLNQNEYIEMKKSGNIGYTTSYTCTYDYNELVMNYDNENKSYNLRYYSTSINQTRNSANRHMYFDETDFDNFNIGMKLSDYKKTSNSAFYRNACCVQSDYTNNGEENIYTVKFIYAITDEFENISHYELEFYNGELIKKCFNGKYGDVTYQYYY